MTRLVAWELEARGILYSNLNGSVPSEKRKELIDRFTDDPEVRVFLSTDAGATGLNLQAASYVINMDLPWNPAVLEQRIGRIYRMGQKRNIQVVNLVAVSSIEEQMLTKLKFKTDLFDGVLNGGEDEVFLDNGKLETLVRDLGFGAEEGGSERQRSAQTAASAPTAEPSVDEGTGIVEDTEPSRQREVEHAEDPSAMAEDEMTPDVIIAQGVSFLGNLVRTLQNADASQKLVDSLVKEDPVTGQASISIPVYGKEPVRQFIKLLSALLK